MFRIIHSMGLSRSLDSSSIERARRMYLTTYRVNGTEARLFDRRASRTWASGPAKKILPLSLQGSVKSPDLLDCLAPTHATKNTSSITIS